MLHFPDPATLRRSSANSALRRPLELASSKSICIDAPFTFPSDSVSTIARYVGNLVTIALRLQCHVLRFARLSSFARSLLIRWNETSPCRYDRARSFSIFGSNLDGVDLIF
jgi:hypothetical protein